MTLRKITIYSSVKLNPKIEQTQERQLTNHDKENFTSS